MIHKLKKLFYFPIALYFAIFAKIRLILWKPKIVVVTGSSGKTTLLNMIESQMGNMAKYSHNANSSYGIPFDILDLKRKDLTLLEWPMLLLSAPFSLFKPVPKQKIYVAEADCDRPFEGTFLGKLLKPNVTLWINTTKTHSLNFEKLSGDLLTNITNEFGQLAKNTKDIVIYNSDLKNLSDFVKNINIPTEAISLKNHKLKYSVSNKGTTFEIDESKFEFKYLLPEISFYQILMCMKLLKIFEIKINRKFQNFILPPGRSSIFRGFKQTTLIDSTYNANLDSMKVILSMFGKISSKHKWIVLGDMLEQGKNETTEHQKLGNLINKYNFEKTILMGPRIKRITGPQVKDSILFETPDRVLEYLKNNLKGGEIVLFKGARFLEGVVEALLMDPKNASNLVRRELVWKKRRSKFGL